MTTWGEKKTTEYLDIIKRKSVHHSSGTFHALFHLFILTVLSQYNFGRWWYKEVKWLAQHHTSSKWWISHLYPESLTLKLWILKLKTGSFTKHTMDHSIFWYKHRELPLRKLGALNKLRKNRVMSISESLCLQFQFISLFLASHFKCKVTMRNHWPKADKLLFYKTKKELFSLPTLKTFIVNLVGCDSTYLCICSVNILLHNAWQFFFFDSKNT